MIITIIKQKVLSSQEELIIGLVIFKVMQLLRYINRIQ